MKALIDGDILRYEIGYAAETGWKAITDRDEIPPFDYVKDLLDGRIAYILNATGATEYEMFLTEGQTFRDEIAITKPYKGNRIDKKPWHYYNLTAHINGAHPTTVVRGIEADDQIAIVHISSEPNATIICSRDKDLRQVPGLLYSWELGKQPSFGPVEITKTGMLSLSKGQSDSKIKGTGFAFYCAQLLTGDIVDNIPGCPGVGPVKAYEILSPILEQEHTNYIQTSLIETVKDVYEEKCGEDAQRMFLEQAQLLWIVRRLNEDGTPEIWKEGLFQ